MPARILARIQEAIRGGNCDVTIHATEETAEDDLDLIDMETALLKEGWSRQRETTREDRGILFTAPGPMEPRPWGLWVVSLKSGAISSLRSSR